ncbi:MAG: hypothetical protein ACJ8GN_18515 [Longimicrobiaceae bacterium]
MTTDTMAPPLRTELAAACGAARAGGRAAMRFYGSARGVEKEGGPPVTEAERVRAPIRRVYEAAAA